MNKQIQNNLLLQLLAFKKAVVLHQLVDPKEQLGSTWPPTSCKSMAIYMVASNIHIYICT